MHLHPDAPSRLTFISMTIWDEFLKIQLGDPSGCSIIMHKTNIDLHLHPDGSPGWANEQGHSHLHTFKSSVHYTWIKYLHKIPINVCIFVHYYYYYIYHLIVYVAWQLIKILDYPSCNIRSIAAKKKEIVSC